jgi:hypothetical protein
VAAQRPRWSPHAHHACTAGAPHAQLDLLIQDEELIRRTSLDTLRRRVETLQQQHSDLVQRDIEVQEQIDALVQQGLEHGQQHAQLSAKMSWGRDSARRTHELLQHHQLLASCCQLLQDAVRKCMTPPAGANVPEGWTAGVAAGVVKQLNAAAAAICGLQGAVDMQLVPFVYR